MSAETTQPMRTRQRRFAGGQCPRCGGPPEPGARDCVPCREVAREADSRRHHARLAAGACARCGGKKADPAKKRCARCLAQMARYNRRRAKELAKLRRCVGCARRMPADREGKRCEPCALKRARQQTPDATRRHPSWTAAERLRLKAMIRALRTAAEIGAELGRSPEGVRRMALTLKIGAPAREARQDVPSIYEYATARRAA